MIQLRQKLQLYKLLILALIGGSTYYGIEILYRGYSHWTMIILGALCFTLLGEINIFLSWDTPLYLQALIGTIIVTTLEFIFGVVFNLWLGWGIWDYSELKFNFMGQISLIFSCAWYGLSIVAIVVDDYLRYCLFDEDKPRYKIF